jgi:hypothetical protein
LRSSRSSSSKTALAAKYEALLTRALAIARRKARNRPLAVREILATGTVEGLSSRLDSRIAVVSYRAEKYKRTWRSLISWQYLEHSSAADWADSMIETVEENIRRQRKSRK